jgi:hypothetical protein
VCANVYTGPQIIFEKIWSKLASPQQGSRVGGAKGGSASLPRREGERQPASARDVWSSCRRRVRALCHALAVGAQGGRRAAGALAVTDGGRGNLWYV